MQLAIKFPRSRSGKSVVFHRTTGFPTASATTAATTSIKWPRVSAPLLTQMISIHNRKVTNLFITRLNFQRRPQRTPTGVPTSLATPPTKVIPPLPRLNHTIAEMVYHEPHTSRCATQQISYSLESVNGCAWVQAISGLSADTLRHC